MTSNKILYIIFGIVLLGLAGFSFSHTTQTTVTSPTVTPQPTLAPGFLSFKQSARNDIQLQTFTPTPTIQSTKNTGVDFSSPSLDWDDVGAIFYYTGFNPLSSKCTTEINFPRPYGRGFSL